MKRLIVRWNTFLFRLSERDSVGRFVNEWFPLLMVVAFVGGMFVVAFLMHPSDFLLWCMSWWLSR